MPLTVHCDGCGVVLYEGEALKPPYELIQKYEGRCPHCRRKLSHIPVNLEVIPIELDVPSSFSMVKNGKEQVVTS